MQLTQRRLTDLWVVGKEVTVDDGAGPSITVWLQKANMVEANESARHANAARARVLALKADPDSDEYQAVRSAVFDYSHVDEMISFLLLEERSKVERAQELILANDEKWNKDEYLQGLRDAWADGMERRWLEDKTDAEAARVKDAMQAFADEVTGLVNQEMDLRRQAMKELPLEELQDRMTDRLLDMDANQVWVHELYRSQLFYGTRFSDNHKQRYFVSRAEVDELAATTFQQLRAAYQELEVEVGEGKDLPAPTDSSSSSEPPNGEETEASSGLVGATA